MKTKTTTLIIGLALLSCVAFGGPLRAQTVSLTPEQIANLERIRQLEEQKLADAHRLAQAQIRAEQMKADAQLQAMKLMQKEAARAKISSNFAMGDAVLSAAKAGWEQAAPEVDRKARDARIKMATSALDSWTPPAGYRQNAPQAVALKNPFAPAGSAVENVAVAPATSVAPVTLASALAGTCLVVDDELQMVRVGEGCGDAGFDGRLAAGMYPLLPGGDVLDTPERAREFLSLAAQPDGILWAYSPATKQVVRTSPKGAKS